MAVCAAVVVASPCEARTTRQVGGDGRGCSGAIGRMSVSVFPRLFLSFIMRARSWSGVGGGVVACGFQVARVGRPRVVRRVVTWFVSCWR